MHHGKIGKEIARGLEELRGRIEAAEIHASTLDESFNLATWNIRELGRRRRKKASIHYIAEIMNEFDIVAVTEVRDNLSDLKRVLEVLGPYWQAVFSDYNTDAGGNRERVAYVYDSRMVRFTGLAAEADPPRKKKDGEYLSRVSWWRSPYMASFRAGNFDFVLITAHIRWGKKDADRIGPLQLLADWIEKRRKEQHVTDRDIILLGDFNIPTRKDALFGAITSRGLQIPKGLRGVEHGTNLAKEKRYDQILHYATHPERFTNHGGVLDFYADNVARLYPGQGLSKHDFTFQLSDHLPLWIQIDSDIERQRLHQILG